MPPKQTTHRHSTPGEAKAEEQAAAEARVQELMQRSIVTQKPEQLYTTYSNGGVVSAKERREATKKRKKENRDTLSQWYGMKRFSKNMSRSMRQDLELLRYRNFLSKDTSHLASARGGSKKIAPYFELGYFTDASSKKRKQSKRFADEMLNEDSELKERVQQVAKREIRRRKKENDRKKKKLESVTKERKGASRRKAKRS